MRALVLLAVLPVAAWAQEMAFIRPMATVEEPVVRVRDLFENAGSRAEAPLGPAPAPGRRIVLEAEQLAAIARMNRVPWRPMSAADRVVLERPGRQVPRAEVEGALREELLRMGMDAESELEIPGWVPPMVPIASLHQVTIEGAVLETPGNRFAATLVITAEGMATQRLRLAGRAMATTPVVVATRRMGMGERLGPADVREVRMRVERVRNGMASRADQVLGQELHRPIAAEGPIPLADLGPPSVIQRNQAVTLLLDAPGITLTAAGRALESAPRGAVVPVMNLASRAVMEGEVLGPGRVRVAMGTVPTRNPRDMEAR
ncbi:flagellar basal body P-ring formation protein FlgA [Rhodovarius crocodyli]|uniref:Flagellar basal body P-ring formation protein FlgA n=1 Tax=Rhodovarius crocodyli TaxID=1979269 RepID=A0A437MHN2_9PROT|nr:flagellar basal body P-ring formation chaperone FlgA [Rhodovarius crocodyli]RVT97115.1 flagellar basal body P-ring formation protein FlgA [Rhodovarius crocodyli]